MMALVTFTSCDEDEDPNEDPDEIENGNNGGVAGKRIKTVLQTTGPMDGTVRSEFTYNSDGTLKRGDYYDSSSKLLQYEICTANSDGTHAKGETHNSDGSLFMVLNYTYDANKKPLKAEGTLYSNGEQPIKYDYTFENGRRTLYVVTLPDSKVVNKYEHIYASNGTRTKTIETSYYNDILMSTREFTRTYNSDGTLQKVTYQNGDNAIITLTYTWENGKTNVNYDDFNSF